MEISSIPFYWIGWRIWHRKYRLRGAMGAHIWSVNNGFPSIFHLDRIADIQFTYRRLIVHQFRPNHDSHIAMAFLSEEVKAENQLYACTICLLVLITDYNLQINQIRKYIAHLRHCADRAGYRANVRSHAQFFIGFSNRCCVCADYIVDNATQWIRVQVSDRSPFLRSIATVSFQFD